MGSSEEVKSEKSPSPAAEQPNDGHVYPDWAAMQAYYGHRVALPPYFNSAVASGHPPPPYMWAAPQAMNMMPPYGAAYAAVYPHGGVYAHPGVPIGSQALGQGAASSTPASGESLAGPPLSMDVAAKKSANTADQGFVKKLKGLDGLAMSIGNGSSEKAEGATETRLSRSSESEGSTDDGSDGNTTGTDDNKRKRSCDGTPTPASNEKAERKATPLPAGQLGSSTDKVLGVPVASAKGSGKMMGTTVSTTTTLELRNPGTGNGKGNPVTVTPSSSAVVSSENWVQNERELKRERRKQSNRESARRSRLRKQAEAEELAKRVDSLSAENMALKSEIDQILENSERLRHENAKLMEKLKNPGAGGNQADDVMVITNNAGGSGMKRNTENLLSKMSSNSSVRNGEEGSDVYEKSGNNNTSGAKLHQLLDANPRADAVAAG